MTGLEAYSVLDTTFARAERSGKAVVCKTIRLHPSLYARGAQIFSEMRAYRNALADAGVPVPSIDAQRAGPEQIYCECEDRGDNLMQWGGPLAVLADAAVLQQVIACVARVHAAGLALDPHIKNFVIADGLVSYVDFSPPWTADYMTLRLSVATPDERPVLRDYFACMQPALLGYHLASDLLKVDARCQETMSALHATLAAQQLVTPDYAAFCRQMHTIIQIEQQREAANLFLL